jgi:diaminohydroxyphosphoribosylaminopyrimidine deaminase/5-amino-6-(5-phosphoribosylamino)uracil reductase
MSASSNDAQFMQEAIRLGLLHLGQTATNPSVGCVIVRDGQIVGRGTTAVGGRPHAEPEALGDAGELARGATAYVTLEPCSHHGKTPPCADALIASGVARVVISVTDPDERVSGRGIAMLRDAGIEVEAGLLENEGRAFARRLPHPPDEEPPLCDSEACRFRRRHDRPQGRGADCDHRPRRPRRGADASRRNGCDPRRYRHGDCRRSGVDRAHPRRGASLAGSHRARSVAATAAGVEDCQHGGRRSGDRGGARGDSTAEMDEPGLPPTNVKDTPQANAQKANAATLESRRQALEAAGVEVLYCHPYHPEQLLPALASRGISSLLVEGGAKTARLFLDAGYVDRILLYQGSGTIGDGGIETPICKTDIPSDFKHVGTRIVGDDSLDEYEREF